jgi:hypothetical protein
MSLKSKILLGAATVFVGIAIHRRNVKADHVVGSSRSLRRRLHFREGIFFLGSGVLIGGTAAVTLASVKRRNLVAWLGKASSENIGAPKNPVREHPPTPENSHDGLTTLNR